MVKVNYDTFIISFLCSSNLDGKTSFYGAVASKHCKIFEGVLRC